MPPNLREITAISPNAIDRKLINGFVIGFNQVTACFKVAVGLGHCLRSLVGAVTG